MPENEPGQIVFGKGGLIAEVPQNEELLYRVAEARPLSTPELFKLVTFFLGYPTNKPLAKHLALYASISFIVSLKQRDGVLRQELVAAAIGDDEPDTVLGVPEADWLDGWNEPGPDELRENPFEVRLAHIKWVSHSGTGLLVEAVQVDDTDRLAYYVVAACPNPAILPED